MYISLIEQKGMILFFFPLFSGGKRKGENNNLSRGQKSCLSAQSISLGNVILTNLVKCMGNPSYLLLPLFSLKILYFGLSTSLSILLCIFLLSKKDVPDLTPLRNLFLLPSIKFSWYL